MTTPTTQGEVTLQVVSPDGTKEYKYGMLVGCDENDNFTTALVMQGLEDKPAHILTLAQHALYGASHMMKQILLLFGAMATGGLTEQDGSAILPGAEFNTGGENASKES